jgi:hypothetical protein
MIGFLFNIKREQIIKRVEAFTKTLSDTWHVFAPWFGTSNRKKINKKFMSARV